MYKLCRFECKLNFLVCFSLVLAFSLSLSKNLKSTKNLQKSKLLKILIRLLIFILFIFYSVIIFKVGKTVGVSAATKLTVMQAIVPPIKAESVDSFSSAKSV